MLKIDESPTPQLCATDLTFILPKQVEVRVENFSSHLAPSCQTNDSGQ